MVARGWFCPQWPTRGLWPSLCRFRLVASQRPNVNCGPPRLTHRMWSSSRCNSSMHVKRGPVASPRFLDPCPETHAQRERAQMSPSRTSQGQPSRQMRARRIARSLRPCLAQHVNCCARKNAQKHMLVSRSVEEANLSIPQVVLPPFAMWFAGMDESQHHIGIFL